MWMLLFVIARADEPRVEVAGVGTVPLRDAAETCLAGEPRASLAPFADRSRVPAFRTVAVGLLSAGEPTRREYFRLSGSVDWPTREVDATYGPESLDWAVATVGPACWAAGRYWVERGAALRAGCTKKSACREVFAPDEQEVLALAGKRVGYSDPDALLHAMAEVAAASDELDLWSWADPGPMLERACNTVTLATTAGLFVDIEDLAAARSGCLQLLALIDPARLTELPTLLPCPTPFRELSDTDGVVLGVGGDLGVSPPAGPAREARVAEIAERLHRMDPSPAVCEGGFGSAWRKNLLERYRAAQRTSSCADDRLELGDRAALCPDLLIRQQQECDNGDAEACVRVGTMLADGIGADADESAAVVRWLEACTAGKTKACKELSTREAAVTKRVLMPLEAAKPIPVPTRVALKPGELPPVSVPLDAPERIAESAALAAAYAVALGPEWHAARAVGAVEAAIEARLPDLARSLLDGYPDLVVGEQRTSLEADLGALVEGLAATAKRRPK